MLDFPYIGRPRLYLALQQGVTLYCVTVSCKGSLRNAKQRSDHARFINKLFPSVTSFELNSVESHRVFIIILKHLL